MALTAVICDDDPITRQVARSVFEKMGYSVLAGVATAMDALNLVLAHRPDVLLLDLVMPGIAGEEIIEAIHECCDTKIVVYSAHDPRYAVKSGARLFVSKGQTRQLEKMLERIAQSDTVPA